MARSLKWILGTAFQVIVLAGPLTAQSTGINDPKKDTLLWYIQQKYGLDQELINGTQYYERYTKYKGHPYFPENHFYKGNVSLRGKPNLNVEIKYDIFTQHLVLAYTDLQGRFNQLNLDRGQTGSFKLGTLEFEKLSHIGEQPAFYQVMKAGPLKCYIHWEKDARPISFDFKYTHEFGDPKGVCYVWYEDELHLITNRRSIIAVLPDHLRPEMMKYLRKHRINFRKPDRAEVEEMIKFTADLVAQDAME